MEQIYFHFNLGKLLHYFTLKLINDFQKDQLLRWQINVYIKELNRLTPETLNILVNRLEF